MIPGLRNVLNRISHSIHSARFPTFIMRAISICIVSILLGWASAYPVLDGDLVYEEEPKYVDLVPIRRTPRGAVLPLRQKVFVVPQGGYERSGPRVYQERPQRRFSESRGDMSPVASGVEPITAETGYGHSSHPYDYVDYGAYTGGYGAFGWYSDHPVYTQGGGGGGSY